MMITPAPNAKLDFHTARHTLYSPEENMEIDKVVPVSASVKTKLGRGGQDDE